MQSNFFQRPSKPIKLKAVPETARADFLVAVDDSLVPHYKKGDILMIQKQPDVFEGEIGLFLIGGKSHVKRRGKNALFSLNDSIPPVPMSEDIQGLGRVIGVLNPEWREK